MYVHQARDSNIINTYKQAVLTPGVVMYQPSAFTLNCGHRNKTSDVSSTEQKVAFEKLAAKRKTERNRKTEIKKEPT
jgi:hypothetical protein